MKIFIIVPLDFRFSPLSIAGKQFEEKTSTLARILNGLGYNVDRLFITDDMAKVYAEDKKKQLESLADMLNRIIGSDAVFLMHRSDMDATPVWWPPMRDLLRGYGIVIHESLDTLLGYKETETNGEV